MKYKIKIEDCDRYYNDVVDNFDNSNVNLFDYIKEKIVGIETMLNYKENGIYYPIGATFVFDFYHESADDDIAFSQEINSYLQDVFSDNDCVFSYFVISFKDKNTENDDIVNCNEKFFSFYIKKEA